MRGLSRCREAPSEERAKKEGDSDPPWHRHLVSRPPWKRRKEYYERDLCISGFSTTPLHPKYSSGFDGSKNSERILSYVPHEPGPPLAERHPERFSLVRPVPVHYDRDDVKAAAGRMGRLELA
jgi:hypothetical protein